MTEQPPPLPTRSQDSPPIVPGEVKRRPPEESLESYNTVAETVGLIPTLRVKDNVVQAIAVLAGIGVGALAGYLRGGGIGAAAGAAVGMIAAALVSGVILMVLGWMRASKRRRG